MDGSVVAVCAHSEHGFSKTVLPEIELLAGLGVAGDAHCGATVQHRSRVRANPDQPNLRQVHVIHSELHRQLQADGFNVSPGVMGENITTQGLNVLDLPTGTRLHLGQQALIELTGLRNPCSQLEDYQTGLQYAVLERTDSGEVVRKAGVMAIVLVGGVVRSGDLIRVVLPPEPHEPLKRV